MALRNLLSLNRAISHPVLFKQPTQKSEASQQWDHDLSQNLESDALLTGVTQAPLTCWVLGVFLFVFLFNIFPLSLYFLSEITVCLGVVLLLWILLGVLSWILVSFPYHWI